MTPQMIQIALWIPFVFVIAITLPIFCSTGYRRGAWNALVSLVATILAAVASVLLARALAEPVSRPIVRELGLMLAGRNGGMSMGMETMLINGIVCVFMAMGLYFLLMLVLTILFKYIAKALWGEELERREAGMRWGGLMVRLIDGVLYALLLLLPLYGSLGNVLPVLASITDISEVDPQAHQALTAVTQHPVAKVSSVGPLKIVYSELAVVPTESGDIGLVEVTESVTGTVEHYQELKEAIESGEMTLEKAEELVDFLREDVLYQPWVYSAYRELLNSFPPEAYEEPGFSQLLELMDMDQKAFVKNMDSILAVVQYALDEGVVEQLMEKPEQAIDILYESGVMERLGEMINSSQESIGLRDLLIRETVGSVCKDDDRAVSSLMASYDSQLHLDQESRLRDTEAMLLISGACDGHHRLNNYEALLRLGFDQGLLWDVFQQNEPDALYEYISASTDYAEEKHAELKHKYGMGLSVQELVWQEVLASAQLPLEEYPRFDRNVPEYNENAYDQAASSEK